MNSVKVYDNGGETADRYTVIINGDVYGMSGDAMSPQGFNQFCGTVSDYSGDFGLTPVNLAELPAEVKTAIALRLPEAKQ